MTVNLTKFFRSHVVVVARRHMPKMYRLAPDEAGVSLIEMAISLPLVAVLMSGLIDCGVALYKHPSLVSAAREGAIVAARVEPVTAIPGEEIRLAAVASACAALERSGPATGSFRIGVRSVQLPLSAGQTAEAIEVTVLRDSAIHFSLASIFVKNQGATSVVRVFTQVPPSPAESVTACV